MLNASGTYPLIAPQIEVANARPSWLRAGELLTQINTENGSAVLKSDQLWLHSMTIITNDYASDLSFMYIPPKYFGAWTLYLYWWDEAIPPEFNPLFRYPQN